MHDKCLKILFPKRVVATHLSRGKYLGDIVVGDIGDIGQPQCHTCTKKQKNIMKEKVERHLWHCGWPMSQCHQPQCHPSATPYHDGLSSKTHKTTRSLGSCMKL